MTPHCQHLISETPNNNTSLVLLNQPHLMKSTLNTDMHNINIKPSHWTGPSRTFYYLFGEERRPEDELLILEKLKMRKRYEGRTPRSNWAKEWDSLPSYFYPISFISFTLCLLSFVLIKNLYKILTWFNRNFKRTRISSTFWVHDTKPHTRTWYDTKCITCAREKFVSCDVSFGLFVFGLGHYWPQEKQKYFKTFVAKLPRWF